jgi:hypothetical protein
MGWLKDRVATVTYSIELKRALAIPFIIAVVTAVIRLVPVLGGGPGVLLGVPAVAWGIGAALLLILYYMIEYATGLRMRLQPKFAVLYDNNSQSFRKPIKLTADQGVTTTRGVSIRAEVRCLSSSEIEQCSGYLTKIEYRHHGSPFSEIPIYEPNILPWALEEFSPVSVFPNVPKYLGICSSREEKNAFVYRTNVRSLVAPDQFTSEGEYRFHIEIVAKNCAPVSKVVCIFWNGKWDDITASLA